MKCSSLSDKIQNLNSTLVFLIELCLTWVTFNARFCFLIKVQFAVSSCYSFVVCLVEDLRFGNLHGNPGFCQIPFFVFFFLSFFLKQE